VSIKLRHIFKEFIDATANIIITESEVIANYQKRAHNQLLIAACFDEVDIKVSWLQRKRLRFVLGRGVMVLTQKTNMGIQSITINPSKLVLHPDVLPACRIYVNH